MNEETKKTNEEDRPGEAGSEFSDRLGRKRWFFSWTNFSGSRTTCLTFDGCTESEAYEKALEMGWKPIRWWQWWRWMNDDNYHGAA